MCTSITMKTNDFYFGRTMDLDYDLSSSVVITPRNYPIRFRRANTLNRHYALIGMAYPQGQSGRDRPPAIGQ